MLSRIGRAEEARTELAEAVEIMEALYREQPDNVIVAVNLGNAQRMASSLYLAAGDSDRALGAAERDLEIASALAGRPGASLEVRLSSAFAHGECGDVRKARGEMALAAESYEARDRPACRVGQ